MVFYNQFQALWEANVSDDFHVQMRAVGKRTRLCCCHRLTCVRYFNYLEWLSFWKVSGWILGDGQEQQKFHLYLLREFEKMVRRTLKAKLAVQILPLIILQIVLFNLQASGPETVDHESSFELTLDLNLLVSD